jgi:hypothetical protein
MVTKDILRELFNYQNGDLVRKTLPRKRYANAKKSEYLSTFVNGVYYRTHKLVFLYHYGYIPKQIDHIDNNKHNNCVENLRECLPSNNSMNIGIRSDNSSGVKGVAWEPKRKKWRVRVCAQGKTMYSGRFEDIELAELVAIEARNKYHKEYANHGVV